ncbi:MAG TPA: site-specific DNA-methyltransferase [Mycobacteriales bacterium]
MTVYHVDHDVTLHVGDTIEVMRGLPEASVDCVVTSPPYYGLRDYGHSGQYGLEATPAEYVARMVEVFAEVRRVLRPDGTLWLNIGDSYAYPPGSAGRQGRGQRTGRTFTAEGRPGTRSVPPKNLLGIPWRVAFGLQDDGWILRSEIIWAKRNFMPESVTDRPTRAHETVFLLTRSPRYWYDADAIREDSDPRQEAHNRRYAREYQAHTGRAASTGQPGNVNNIGIHSRPGRSGRNARDVWSISAQPYPEAHFAVMPPELARRCILAGCRPGGTVLDPFSGSGTTGMVARQTGRRYVGIDLRAEYHDLAIRRLGDTPLDFTA